MSSVKSHSVTKLDSEARQKSLHEIVEAVMRNQSLSTSSTQVILSQMNSLTALDLSQNQISKFPRNFPVSLLALDLSFNSIVVVSSTALKKLSNLIELSLANNKITSLEGVGEARSLQYLDVSNNQIIDYVGAESLFNLKTLDLSNNRINHVMKLRSISFNTLKGNPLGRPRDYRSVLKNFSQSLVVLDGVVMTGASCLKSNATSSPLMSIAASDLKLGYVNRFDKKSSTLTSNKTSAAVSGNQKTMSKLKRTQSGISLGSELALEMASLDVDEGYLSDDTASIVDTDVTSEYSLNGTTESPSPIPWRNPPRIMPRVLTVKGKPLLSATMPPKPKNPGKDTTKFIPTVTSKPSPRGKSSPGLNEGFIGFFADQKSYLTHMPQTDTTWNSPHLKVPAHKHLHLHVKLGGDAQGVNLVVPLRKAKTQDNNLDTTILTKSRDDFMLSLSDDSSYVLNSPVLTPTVQNDVAPYSNSDLGSNRPQQAHANTSQKEFSSFGSSTLPKSNNLLSEYLSPHHVWGDLELDIEESAGERQMNRNQIEEDTKLTPDEETFGLVLYDSRALSDALEELRGRKKHTLLMLREQQRLSGSDSLS